MRENETTWIFRWKRQKKPIVWNFFFKIFITSFKVDYFMETMMFRKLHSSMPSNESILNLITKSSSNIWSSIFRGQTALKRSKLVRKKSNQSNTVNCEIWNVCEFIWCIYAFGFCYFSNSLKIIELVTFLVNAKMMTW